MQDTVIGTFNRAPVGIRLDRSDKGPLWVIRAWSRWGIVAVHISPAFSAYSTLRHGVRVTWSLYRGGPVRPVDSSIPTSEKVSHE